MVSNYFVFVISDTRPSENGVDDVPALVSDSPAADIFRKKYHRVSVFGAGCQRKSAVRDAVVLPRKLSPPRFCHVVCADNGDFVIIEHRKLKNFSELFHLSLHFRIAVK